MKKDKCKKSIVQEVARALAIHENLRTPVNYDALEPGIDPDEDCLHEDLRSKQNPKCCQVRMQDEPPTVEDTVLTIEMIQQVWYALTSLSNDMQKVLTLYHGLDGNDPMTMPEIAKQTGMHVNAVKRTKEKAYRHLRRTHRSLGEYIFS